MRIATHGIARQGEGFSFSYEGDPVEASPGESIAAALVSANRLTCRTTRSGEPRGVYCGMGVCGECAVIVDGRPRRACMEMAVPGISVERQPALRALPEVLDEDSAVSDSYSSRDIDVLVIGAGPAGLAAAREAAHSGATVLLVDERPKAGGQYFKQPGYGFAVDETRIDGQFREGLALYRSAIDVGVEFCFGATVWGAFPGPQIAIATASGSELLNAGRVVVSPGAYESPMPFPGWTLPGVMTTGAAQTLLRAYQTAPGQRVLVAGNGPLNLQVARELTAAGVQVVAVLELAKAPSLRKAADVLQMCLTSPGLLRSGFGHMIRLARAQVPVFHQHRVIQARGDERVESVVIARVGEAGLPIAGSEQQFSVDAVCLGYGFLAQSEIARALGAGLGIMGDGNSPQTQSDIAGRSATAPEVFVAGDASGLGGARVAISQGALAGAAAARDLGYAADAPGQRSGQKHQRALARHRRFQKALWSLYAAPTSALAVADEQTIICRCESVTLGRIQAQAAQGVAAIGAIKRETRAGMGRCQGRYCAGLLNEIVGEADSAIVEEQAYFAPRPPFKPLSIKSLAAVYNPALTFDRTAGAQQDQLIGTDSVVRDDLP